MEKRFGRSCSLFTLFSFAFTIFTGRNTSSNVVPQDNHVIESPPLSALNDSCPRTNTTYVYTDLQGSIVWDEALCPGTCWPSCQFLLRVPHRYGLFVEFHQVQLWFQPGPQNKYDIYSFDEERWKANDKLVLKCLTPKCSGAFDGDYVTRSIQGTLPVAPLSTGNILSIWVYSTHSNVKMRHRSIKSRFDISYHTIPHEQYSSDFSYFHLCAYGNNSYIPHSLQCNKVPQCIHEN